VQRKARSSTARRAYDARVRTALLGLIWITACYSPKIPLGERCSVNGTCPEGQSCVGGFCGGGNGVDAGAGADASLGTKDTDMDRVPDDQDNCPSVKNTEQLDEDNDKVGDACDACPYLASAAATDSDGDGLPDACDKSPMTADVRWLFEGFHAGLPTGWTWSMNWSATGDGKTVRVAAPGTGNNDEFIDIPLSMQGRTYNTFTLTAGFTIDATVGNNGAVIGFDVFDLATNMGLDCMLVQNGGNTGDRHLVLDDDVRTIGNQGLQWQTGVQYTLTLVNNAGAFTCSVVGSNGQQSTTNGSSGVKPRDGASMSLLAYGMTAHLDWLFVTGASP
jgi:hypothetical protein